MLEHKMVMCVSVVIPTDIMDHASDAVQCHVMEILLKCVELVAATPYYTPVREHVDSYKEGGLM